MFLMVYFEYEYYLFLFAMKSKHSLGRVIYHYL